MTTTITTKNGQQLARPLKVLVPLIKEDLRQGGEAAKQAGMPYYINAGEKLIEAKSQLTAMSWGTWLKRNFHLSQETARVYMRVARETGDVTRFESLAEMQGDTRTTVRSHWTGPVRDVLKNLKASAFNLQQHDLSLSKERAVERKLGLQLIDIGYKVLSVKLHPDKGGSHDAMSRLNRARARLKQAA